MSPIFSSAGRIRTEPVPLSELLSGIHAGSVAMPEFQRPYIWTDKDVRQMIVTAMMNWPAGSLLVLRDGDDRLSATGFTGGPNLRGVELLILDGQQRLTALYHALYDTGPRVYYVSVEDLGPIDVDELDERVRSTTRRRWNRDYANPEIQFRKGVIPLYAAQSAISFFAWRDDVLASIDELNRPHTRDALTRLYGDLLSSLSSYQFPVVELPRKTDLAAIARVFERVNKSGWRLNAFDLMVAKTFEPGWNLRGEWNAARTKTPLVWCFLEEDGLPLLRAIALKLRGSVRDSAVLALNAPEVHGALDNALSSCNAAIEFMRSHCGVANRDFLPYQANLILLTALAMDTELRSHTDLLRAWFFASSLSGRYDTASNTSVMKDYSAVLEAVSDPANTFSPPLVYREDLLDLEIGSSRGLTRAFLCLLAAAEPVDLVSNARLGLSTTDCRLPENIRLAPLLPGSKKVMLQVLADEKSVPKMEAAGLQAILESEAARSQLVPDWEGVLSENADMETLLPEYRFTTVADRLVELGVAAVSRGPDSDEAHEDTDPS